MDKIIKRLSQDRFFLGFISIGTLLVIASLLFLWRGFLPEFSPPFLSFKKIYFLYAILLLFLLATFFQWLRNPPKKDKIARTILFIFLPSAVLLLIAFLFSEKTLFLAFLPKSMASFVKDSSFLERLGSAKGNHTVRFFVNTYWLFAAGYLIAKIRDWKKISDFFNEWREKREKFSWKIWLAVSFISLSFFAFGMNHLGKFAAVDEPLWTNGRIHKFWSNVADGEFWKTMVSDKPGITTAIISGPGLISNNSSNLNYIKRGDPVSAYVKKTEDTNIAFRLPLLLFASLSIFVFFIILSAVFGRKVGLLATAFIGLSPLLLGISTFVNPDSLLWIFAPLSIFSLLVYLNKHTARYLYLSGIFLGLALLTKYVANIIFVFAFGLIFLDFALRRDEYEKIGAVDYLKNALKDYAILVLLALITFFLLLPAAWVEISRLIEGTIGSKAFVSIFPSFFLILILIIADLKFLKGKVSSFVLNFLARYRKIIIAAVVLIFLIFVIATLSDTYGGMRTYDLESILASPKSAKGLGTFFGIMLANVYSLVFGIHPLALAGLIISALVILFRKTNYAIYSLYLLIFILLYYAASTVSGISATVRYQIIIYPIAFAVAAFGLWELVKIIYRSKYFSIVKAIRPLFLLSGIIVILFISLWQIRPFYFSYASNLLPKQYVLNLKDMGDGSYEAAEYLNSLPNPVAITIWTDKRGVCSFFAGVCYSGTTYNQGVIDFNYFVVSAGRESRTSKMVIKSSKERDGLIRFDELYNSENYEWKLEIGGRPNDFVKIIKAQ